jgi:hypothetical protein
LSHYWPHSSISIESRWVGVRIELWVFFKSSLRFSLG